MQKITILIIFIMLALCAKAQPGADSNKQKMMDSVMAARTDEAALMYPRIRQFSITHQQNAVGNIRSKLYGREFFKGRFESSRTTISLSVPIIEKRKSLLIGNLGVVHQFFGISNITSYDTQNPVTPPTDPYIPMISAGVSYTRRDTLFNRPVSFTGSLNGLFDPGFSKTQLTFMGIIAVPLIRRENTTLTGGVIVNIDPSSPAPALIFVSYFHKFRAVDVDLMIDLPYRFALRKPVLKRASVTAFSELAGSNSFFQFENPNPDLPKKMTYSTLEIKSGVLFEYRITRKAVLSISGGVSSTVKSRILEQGAKPNDYFISNKNTAVPFGQIGFSLLPWWKPFKK